MSDQEYGLLIVGIGIVVAACAFIISLTRWILRIDYRCDLQRQILAVLGRIEDRIGEPQAPQEHIEQGV